MPMLTIPPTVTHRPKGLIDCAQITDTLIRPGQDREALYGQTRELLKAGYLWPVAREERGKKAFLMNPDHFLIADVLLRLREFGVRGSEDKKADPFATASLVLRSWIGKKPEGAVHSPAAHVLSEFEVGVSGWMFEVRSFRHSKRDWVQYDARIYRPDPEVEDGFQSTKFACVGGDKSWTPMATVAVDLTDTISFWHPLAKARREAMN